MCVVDHALQPCQALTPLTGCHGRGLWGAFFIRRRGRIWISSSCEKEKSEKSWLLSIYFRMTASVVIRHGLSSNDYADLKQVKDDGSFTYCFSCVCRLLSLSALTAGGERLKVRQGAFHRLLIIICLVFIRQLLWKKTEKPVFEKYCPNSNDKIVVTMQLSLSQIHLFTDQTIRISKILHRKY